jgi:hypothetical protein
MLNKDGSTSWEAGCVAHDDEDIVPIVPAFPLSEETNETSNISLENNPIPVISLPDSSVVSIDQYSPVVFEFQQNEAPPDNEEAQTHDCSTASLEQPSRHLKQEWRDWKHQAHLEWKQLKKSLTHEATIHKHLLKEQHGAFKQQWKHQKQALRDLSRGCGQTVNDEAQIWRDIAREESRAWTDSLQTMQREGLASVHKTKKEILDFSRSFSDLWRL